LKDWDAVLKAEEEKGKERLELDAGVM